MWGVALHFGLRCQGVFFLVGRRFDGGFLVCANGRLWGFSTIGRAALFRDCHMMCVMF